MRWQPSSSPSPPAPSAPPSTRLSLPLGGLLLCAAFWLGSGHQGVTEAEAPRCLHDEECVELLGRLRDEVACRLAPDGAWRCFQGLTPPPNAVVAEALALGRRDAAADVAWLRTVQFVGAPYAESIDYAGIEQWLELITTLAPDFRLPYMVGGIILATSPARASEADRILARAQETFQGDDHSLRMILQWRAFVAYYGLRQPATAADFYQQAYEAGGPLLLKQRAETIRTQVRDCGAVWTNLQASLEELRKLEGGDMLSRTQQVKIMQSCFKEQIDSAASAFHLEHKRLAVRVQELVDAHFLDAVPPTLEAGRCWELRRDRAFVTPCPARGGLP